MRYVYNFVGLFGGGVGRQPTYCPVPKDEKLLEKQEVETDGAQRRQRRVSIGKTLALIGLVLVILSGTILTAFGAVGMPRRTPSSRPGAEQSPWGEENEMVNATATAPSTNPPATNLVFDMVVDDDPKASKDDPFPEGSIKEVLAYVTHKKKMEEELKPKTHKLEKRATQFRDWYVPDDHLCGEGNERLWEGRQCSPTRGIRDWTDFCRPPEGPVTAPSNQLHGQCPEKTQCFSHMTPRAVGHITCVPNQQPLQDNTSEGPADNPPKRRRIDQYGWRGVNRPKTPHSGQIQELVKMDHDIDAATTRARFVDSNKSFVIKTNNEFNANVVGWSRKLCKSTNDKDINGRDCHPLLNWYFNEGDTIAFNFGAGTTQEGYFFYSISGLEPIET